MLHAKSMLGALAALSIATLSSAATWRVGKPNTGCPGAQYTTIKDAVKAAAAGDVIQICPALYAEQLTIRKPLTLLGLRTDNVNRVLVQPSSLTPAVTDDGAVGGLPIEAAIAVIDTHGVNIENLAIDASNNGVTGCNTLVAGVHFYNSSGSLEDAAVTGAEVSGCTGSSALLFGNGFGVQIDADKSGEFDVCARRNSIHAFTRDGIQVVGNGVTARIEENAISGIGPASGVFQFGVFVLNGAVGLVSWNVIHEGNCGSSSISDCIALRSEGVTLRAVGDGTVVEHNIIASAQSGIFINGGKHMRISDNFISDIDALDGMDIQGTASGYFSDSRIERNTIVTVSDFAGQTCGIVEYSGTGVAGNLISHTTVNDAFCGVAYVPSDRLENGSYYNVLYGKLNTDLPFPGPVEPGQNSSGRAARSLAPIPEN